MVAVWQRGRHGGRRGGRFRSDVSFFILSVYAQRVRRPSLYIRRSALVPARPPAPATYHPGSASCASAIAPSAVISAPTSSTGVNSTPAVGRPRATNAAATGPSPPPPPARSS